MNEAGIIFGSRLFNAAPILECLLSFKSAANVIFGSRQCGSYFRVPTTATEIPIFPYLKCNFTTILLRNNGKSEFL